LPRGSGKILTQRSLGGRNTKVLNIALRVRVLDNQWYSGKMTFNAEVTFYTCRSWSSLTLAPKAFFLMSSYKIFGIRHIGKHQLIGRF